MSKTIYIVLYTLSVGGAERHASSIANYFIQHGYRVKIVLIQDNIVEYSLEDGIEVISLADLDYPDSINNTKTSLLDKIRLKIYRKTSENKYNYLDRKLYLNAMYLRKLEFCFSQENDINNSVVLSFMPIPNILTSVLKSKFKYKLVLGEFSSPQLEFASSAPENKLKQEYFPNADGFVFQTSEQEEFYTYLPGVKKQIIPNPIENLDITPYQGERKKEIVNYCKHVKAKNLPLLIEAFSKLTKDYPDYSLVIYGDGPERYNTEKCIAEHNLEKKVLLKPYAKNVLELVRESAMFVSSSDREGISNSMLEAMAIGLPVVCTDCPAGGARMFIDNYVNGLLVPVRDSESLYRAMKFIIDNPEKADTMAKNAVGIRDTLEKNKILGQWFDFINNI